MTRQQAEKEMVAALGEGTNAPVVEIQPTSPQEGPIVLWRFVGSSWPGERPAGSGRPPLHEYEITCSAPGRTPSETRALADAAYDALHRLDGYVEYGETTRLDAGGWTAQLDYAVVLST